MTKECPLVFLTLPAGSGVARKFRFRLYSSRAMAQAVLRFAALPVRRAARCAGLRAGLLAALFAGFLAPPSRLLLSRAMRSTTWPPAGRLGLGAGSDDASSS